MEDIREPSEQELLKTIRNLTYGVLLVSFLPLVFGILYLFAYWFGGVKNIDTIWNNSVAPIIITSIGALPFALGCFLFKKQSYPAAAILTILTGFSTVLSMIQTLGFISWVLFDEDGFGLGRLTILFFFWVSFNFICFWASYKGMKAAEIIKKHRQEKISPEIFS